MKKKETGEGEENTSSFILAPKWRMLVESTRSQRVRTPPHLIEFR